MLDLQPLGGGRVGSFDGAIPDVLALLDGVWVVVKVALGVEVEVRDVVAEIAEDGVNLSVAGRVRRPVFVCQGECKPRREKQGGHAHTSCMWESSPGCH